MENLLNIWNKITYSWKQSFSIAAYIFAFISTIGTIANVTIKNIFGEKFSWWILLLIVIAIYIILVFIIRIILSVKREYSIKVRQNKVIIKQGNIFKEKGLKLIPCNERFDTQVDDVIISSHTLNGKFLKNPNVNIEELKNIIDNSEKPTDLKRKKRKNGTIFPLGRIIKYKDYLLLAFTHFDKNNVANITRVEYEECLFKMWKELRRTYNGEPIILPLIGSGITSFTDIKEKSNIDLLKCIICTLKFSGEQFAEDITIVVTPKTWKDLNLADSIIEL